MMAKCKFNNVIRILISILIILIPINDMLRNTEIRNIQLFGISIIEVVNIIIVCLCLLFTIPKLKRKHLFALGLYCFLVAIYVLFHYNHIIYFDKTIFSFSQFNFLTESFYIFRVYFIPVLLLMIIIINKEIFNFQYLIKFCKLLIIFIAGSIILLNILKISYGSYILKNEFIDYNIFDLFFAKDYRILGKVSTRGWFNSANEISLVLAMLFPLTGYILYIDTKKSNILLYFSHFLAMLIVGTRISSLGSVLISISSVLLYIFLFIIKKEQFNKKYFISLLIITIVMGAYLFKSPYITRTSYNFSANVEIFDEDFDIKDYGDNLENMANGTTDSDNKPVEDENVLAYEIFKKRQEFGISDMALQLYPIEKDVEFYSNLINKYQGPINSRKMKTAIIGRIKERNNNYLDVIFGMGYTLNFPDIERDYLNQYYIYGIVGLVLFIAPYVIIFIISMIKQIVDKKIFSFPNLLIALSPFMGLAACFLSGHLFGYVTPTYILVICLSIYMNTHKNNQNNNIVFLQNTNGLGGVFYVNNTIINNLKNKYNFSVCTIRNDKGTIANYDKDIEHFIVNSKDEWNLITGDKIKNSLKNKRYFETILFLLKRWFYKFKLALDFNKAACFIENKQPKVIICSQYEMLKLIPPEFLKNTFVHHHTSFKILLKNSDNVKTFKRFSSKINSFIWLSNDTCIEAKKYGFINSRYIYNPVRIETNMKKRYLKNVIFIGRFSEEKRVDVLVDIFVKTIEKYKIKDWNLLIYGFGNLNKEAEKIINSKKYIKLCGSTDDIITAFSQASISMNTSSFEGFPMAVLEGNACGVPTISFNFGESVDEVILNGKTGFICENKDEYVDTLARLMNDNQLLEDISNNAYLYSKKFNPNLIKKDWDELFSRMCE